MRSSQIFDLDVGRHDVPGGRTTLQMNRSQWSYPRSPYPTKTTLKRKATYTSPYTCRTPTCDMVHHTTLQVHRWSDTCLGVLLYIRIVTSIYSNSSQSRVRRLHLRLARSTELARWCAAYRPRPTRRGADGRVENRTRARQRGHLDDRHRQHQGTCTTT